LLGLRDWQICASIDGTGFTGEYIRTGLKWAEWLENFRQGLNHVRHRRQMRIDFTLTLPGMTEVENIERLGRQFGADVLAKVIFSFSPDIIMSPLALPRRLLEPWLDELILVTAGAMQDMLIQLKQRPTFEEQWPEQYAEGLARGKRRVLQLESIRKASTDMERILMQRPTVWKWWNDIVC